MATDFSNLLSTKLEDIKRPPVRPAGTYHATISNYQLGESSQKKTPYVRFSFANIQPGEDIDPETLKDTDGASIDLSKWKPTADFYITPDALFRLKDLIEGLKIPSNGRSLNETLPETRGLPVILTVSMRATEDGSGFFNRVESVAAAS